MSADPNACYCGGDTAGHAVECPAAPLLDARRPVIFGLDLGAAPSRSVLRCGCGAFAEIFDGRQLLNAARMVFGVRPENWDDDEDPDQVAAWSALEEALRSAPA